jgi:hypothetical protein
VMMEFLPVPDPRLFLNTLLHAAFQTQKRNLSLENHLYNPRFRDFV